MSEPSASRALAQGRNIVVTTLAYLVVMSVFRLVFLWRFGTAVDLQGVGWDVARALWLGIRYDLKVLCFMQAVPFVLLVAGWAIGREGLWRFVRAATRVYLIAMFTAVSFVLAADIGFYSYFQDHINVVIYGAWEDDPAQLARTIWMNYNVPLAGILAALYIAAVAWVTARLTPHRENPTPPPPVSRTRSAWVVVVLFCALFLGARGGLGVFPLGLRDSAISQSRFVNQLSVNGILSLRRAIQLRAETRRGELDLVSKMGFKDPSDAFAALYGRRPAAGEDLLSLMDRRTPPDPATAGRRPNVVVVLVEALGSFWMRFDRPSFDLLADLRAHFQQDFVFWNFFPSDNGTIGSLLSVTLNMPQRPMFPFLTESEYMQSSFDSSAFLPFARNGYETSYVYGGQISWRDTGKFLALQGAERVEGAADIEANVKSPDGEPLSQPGIWKVYDEYLLEHLLRKLRSGGRPKFIVALTTTNHPPYSVPKRYGPRPLEIPGELASRLSGSPDLVRGRFVAYQYTCQKLGEFLSEIKSSPLGENTIVVVTGDHNFWGVVKYQREEPLERYGVPLYVYLPPAWRGRPVDTSVFGSHLDIMPTLYRLALPDTSYRALGHDLLAKGGPPYAINTSEVAVNRDGGMVEGKRGTWMPDGRFGFDRGDATIEERARGYWRALLAVTDRYVKSQRGGSPRSGDSARH